MAISEKASLYIIFSQILVVFLIAIYSVSYSNPQFFMKGQDSDNNICGADPEVFDYPYVYFLNPTAGLTDKVTCVQKCPTPSKKKSKFLCHPNSQIKTCKPHLDFFEEKNNILVYESFTYMDNVCVPTVFQYYGQITNQIKPQGLTLIGHDLYITRWFTFLFSIILSFILNWVLIIVLDNYIQQSIWIFLISTIGFFGIGGIYYAKTAIYAYNLSHSANTPLNSLQLSAEYIHVQSNLPDVGFNFMMSLLLIILFLISAKWIYDNFNEFEDFFKNFDLVDKFLDEESSSQQDLKINKMEVRSLAIIFAGLFSVVIGIFYFLFLYLIACIDKNLSPSQMNPFTKILQSGLGIFLLFIFFLSASLVTEFTFCCYKFVCSASLVFQIQRIRRIVNQEDTHDTHYVQLATKMLFQVLPQIAKMSIINFLTVIPSLLFYIVEMVDKNKLNDDNNRVSQFYKKYIKYNFYTLTVNICINNYSYDEAMADKQKVLQNDEDYDYFVDLISKPYLFSKSGQILSSAGIYSLLVLVTKQSYFDNLIYSNFVVSVIGAIIAYLITYLFLSYYEMSSETIYYMYFYEKAQAEQQQQIIQDQQQRQENDAKGDEIYINELLSLINKQTEQKSKYKEKIHDQKISKIRGEEP